MKTTTQFSFIALGAALAVISLLPIAVQAQNNQAATTKADPVVEKTVKAMQIPSNLNEIAELTKAGVGDPVILTYIKNSSQFYSLNAQDIISLRDQGVSAEVTTALIQHGAEMRQAAAENYKQTQEAQTATVAVAPTYQTQPVVETPAPVTYVAAPVQPASTVSVTYIGYPSYSYAPAYYSPRYVTYGSGCYTPRVSFGIGFGGGHFGGRFSGGHSSVRVCR